MRGVGCLRFGAAAGSILAALLLFPATNAAAQYARDFETQLFLPPAAGGSTFTIDRPTVPRHLNIVAGIAASYALEPFVRTETLAADGTVIFPQAPVVRHLGQFEALAALGLFEYLELGVAFPVVLIDSADDHSLPTYTYSTSANLGDLRLSAKVPLLRGEVGIAARFVASLPTGWWENFSGMEYWIAQPSLVFAWDPGPLTVSAEVGYRFRQRSSLPGYEQDDEILASAGITVPIIPEVEVIGETQVRIGVGGRTIEANEIPMEVDAGLRFWPVPGLSIEAGAGTGVLAGVGAPPFRAFVTLRYATDEGQSCAAGPEDFDGFEDGDFCADADNDQDGLNDSADECPNDAEDVDQFADDDGCPDLDNDADSVLDGADACPTQSEDRDGFRDEDGCSEPDNDEDGVNDGVDDCPMEPEDADHYQDDDGCPEPGPGAASVTVTDTRILISERIYFDYDRDTIRSVSMPMLDQVARVILELPAANRVRVEGYTDNEGVEQYNIDLSFRRARSVVEYLVGRGVPRNRIEYRGYGPRNPVAPNDSAEGRALNRRVEFTILQAGETSRPRRPQPQR
jgi:outer membrane protein OmpA-like peptidoglycan-associated protein